MESTGRQLTIVALVAVVVVFTNLGGPRLWDRDEPRNAGCAAEMLARGDLITPVFDGELRTHKPILLYWLLMVSYAVFGVSEFSARFWSAAFGVGTALLTYAMGRRLFSPQVGFWGAIAVVTTLMFDVAARAATPDSVLIFWSTAAIAVFVWGTFPAVKQGGRSVGPDRVFPRWSLAALMYGCMGMAMLAKGPVGLVLPTAVIGMFMLVHGLPTDTTARTQGGTGSCAAWVRWLLRPFEPRHFVQTCWRMRPLTALGISLAVALPWYLAVSWRTDGQWVRGFLLDHNLGRAAQSLEGHGGSLFFYPLALLVGFFPWSVFAVPTALETSRRIRRQDPQWAGYVLAVCWIGVYVGLFSLARTKLPSYITPCYPAVALLTAGFLDAWMRGRALSASYWPLAALACLGAVGIGVMVIVPLAAARVLPGEQGLALLGGIPLLTAVLAYVIVRRQAIGGAVRVFGLGAVLLMTSLFAVGAARVDSHQTFDSFVATMNRLSPDPEIGTLGVLEPSWVFYTGRPLDHLFAPELRPDLPADTLMVGQPRTKDWQTKPFWNAWQYLRQGPDRYVITTARHLEQIGTLPDHVVVLARTSYFLQNEELILLGTDGGAPIARRGVDQQQGDRVPTEQR